MSPHNPLLLLLLLLLSLPLPTLSARPPKSYCTPHISLIRLITKSPVGRSFCSSLNRVTITETGTKTCIPSKTTTTTTATTTTVVTTTSVGTTLTNYTTSTTTASTQTVTETSTALKTATATETAISTITKITTITLTTTASQPSQINNHGSQKTLTIRFPRSFPLPLADLIPAFAWPPFLSGIATTSVSSACDCIVGYPTTITTTTEPPPTTWTYTETEISTLTSTEVSLITTQTLRWTNISVTSTTTQTLLTTLFPTTTTTTTTITTTTTATTTKTATVHPSCLLPGFESSGDPGTGNRLEVFSTGEDCCSRCQSTNECVASQRTGWLCQLLLNNVYIAPEPNSTQCQLGIEDYPFFGVGPVFAGPCGY